MRVKTLNWITINKACVKANRTRKTIYNWIEQNLIKTKKEGKKTLVCLEDIEKVISQRKLKSDDFYKLQERHERILQQNEALLEKIEYYQNQLSELKLLENEEIKNKEKIRRMENALKLLKKELKRQGIVVNKYEKASLWDRLRGKKYDLEDDEDSEDDKSDNYYEDDY